MELIQQYQKPGILIISKTWSGSSRDLAASMSENGKLIQLSKQFVMILAQDDNEPEDEKYLPGLLLFFYIHWIDSRERYYPRVFFINSDKSIDYSINNAGFSPLNHFYYYDSNSVYNNAVEYLKSHQLMDDEELWFIYWYSFYI